MVNHKEIEKVRQHFTVGSDANGLGVFHKGTGKKSGIYSTIVNEDSDVGKELIAKLSEQRLRGKTQGL
jgi:hypothetical protein